MRVPHTATNKGRKVRILLRDGTRLEGRFVGRNDREVRLDTGRVNKREIRAFIVVKTPDHDHRPK